MDNEYFDLDRQLRHLVVDKSMMVAKEDFGKIKMTLKNNNYHSWVSTSKIKFAEPVGNKWVMYKTAYFDEWESYFEMDKRVSKHLCNNLLNFERMLNSRISYYLSKMMANNDFSEYEKNEIIQIIQSAQRRKLRLKKHQKLCNPYVGNRTWEYVPKLMFGDMKQLLFWLFDNKREIYLKVVNDYTYLKNTKKAKERIDGINHLRNALVHNEPLNLYLVYGGKSRQQKKLKNTSRKAVVNFANDLNRNFMCDIELAEILAYTDNFIAIKNSRLLIDYREDK